MKQKYNRRTKKLTEREKEFLKLLSEGYTDPQIAEKLNLAVTTVTNMCAMVRLKTGTVNRPHLVGWAYRHNILQ